MPRVLQRGAGRSTGRFPDLGAPRRPPRQDAKQGGGLNGGNGAKSRLPDALSPRPNIPRGEGRPRIDGAFEA